MILLTNTAEVAYRNYVQSVQSQKLLIDPMQLNHLYFLQFKHKLHFICNKTASCLVCTHTSKYLKEGKKTQLQNWTMVQHEPTS